MDDSGGRAAVAKVMGRLVPFLFLLYVVNILDRVNVSFARLQMLDDLRLGEDVYAWGAGIFYVGYLAFEVPSNLILRRVGARRWIARIMVSWGLITCAMAAVGGAWSFYLLRVALGFAEAGFFPGIILYLTGWFPARERARAVAFFMAASPVTGILGNPLSGAVMQFANGLAGLHGWQWVFLLEGLPAVALGVAVLLMLPDSPAQARWLTPEEQDWLSDRVAAEERGRHERHGMSLWQAAHDPRVWLLILLYFTVAAGSNGLGFYLPKLLADRFPEAGQNKFRLGLLAAVPSLCAALCMVLNAAHSDATGERRWHVAVPAFLAALGWAAAGWFEGPLAGLAALTLAQVGIMSMLPTFWSLPTAFLSGVAAAGGIALINSLGNLGGLGGPLLLGELKAHTGSFTGGMLLMAAIMAAGGVLALLARHERDADGGKPWPDAGDSRRRGNAPTAEGIKPAPDAGVKQDRDFP